MTVKITAQQLVNLARVPDSIAMGLAPALTVECNAAGINTNRRLRHFMATILHESAGLKSLVEGLNYSAEGLMATFSRQRISAADCLKFGRTSAHKANQNAIANIIYGGAWGAKNLGNTQPGDGWRYRGRSPIMLTGRANYALMERLTGLPLVANPDMAAEPRYAARIAAMWWADKGLNEVADEDAGERTYSTMKATIENNELDDMRHCRKRVNGGVLGLKDVQDWLIRCGQIWPGK